MTELEFDQDLLLKMSKFYGEAYHLPPLAAKIYAYLVFDFKRNGIPFDELVETFQASKSSVSSSLTLLSNLKIIRDFTKMSERKRYFALNENYMKIRFEEIITIMETELDIVTKLRTFRNPTDERSIRKFDIYQNLFKKNIKNIQDSLEEL